MHNRFLPIILLTVAIISPALAEDYYPLKQGMTWEYELNITSDDSNQSVTIIRKVLTPTSINGQRAIPIQHSTGAGVYAMVFYAEKEDGVVIVATQRVSDLGPKVSDQPELVVPKKTELGTTWKFRQKTQIIGDYDVETTSLIDKVDETVTVPAGVFEHCIRIKISGSMQSPENSLVSLEQYEWYSPNVGRIKTLYEEILVPSPPNSKRTGRIAHQLVKFSK